ncbi:MAG: hypothetical protein QOE07_2833 [Acidimicrobiaceae bacterium]|jgi:hypothetical protein|nr:hypothetical protein [Acidimicrobiaceae bacterium]
MTIYRTEVIYLPATPLGLLPPRWAIHHYCDHCHQQVTTDELVTHAQTHDRANHQ